MSTKLYTFKVPKQSVFTFSDSIRKQALDTWKPVFTNGLSDKAQLSKFIRDNRDDFEKELRFLDITRFKDVYLVQVLEVGYLIHNYLLGLKYPTCNFDDSIDIPRRERGNKAIAEEVDRLIALRHYFIVPAVSVEDYLNIIWNTQAESEKENGQRKEKAG